MNRNKLQRVSKDIWYEFSVFDHTAKRVHQIPENDKDFNPMLESFCLHLRNFIEFFFFSSDKEYVRAANFLQEDKTNLWEAFKKECKFDWKYYSDKANHQVAHITYSRLEFTDEKKRWPVNEIYMQVCEILYQFLLLVESEVICTELCDWKKGYGKFTRRQ